MKGRVWSGRVEPAGRGADVLPTAPPCGSDPAGRVPVLRAVKRALLAVGLALSAALSACAAPAPHPLGTGCTWPADVQPGRDGLAVLITFGTKVELDSIDQEVVLYDVPTDTIRARCAGLAGFALPTPLGLANPDVNPYYQVDQGVNLPPISSDYRLAVTPAGVVDLPTGRLTPPPDPTWVAVGMIGTTGVLRKDTRSNLRADTCDPDAVCVAAHPDTPQDQCGRVPGATAPGQPLITTDGRVEWVPATSVAAVTLTDPGDGTVYTGLAQPGPTQLLSLFIDITGSETGLHWAVGGRRPDRDRSSVRGGPELAAQRADDLLLAAHEFRGGPHVRQRAGPHSQSRPCCAPRDPRRAAERCQRKIP